MTEARTEQALGPLAAQPPPAVRCGWAHDFFLAAFRERVDPQESAWQSYFEMRVGQLLAHERQKHGWRRILALMLLPSQFERSFAAHLTERVGIAAIEHRLRIADARVLASLPPEQYPAYLDECERRAFGMYLKDCPARKRENFAALLYANLRAKVLRAMLATVIPTFMVWVGVAVAFAVAFHIWQRNTNASVFDAIRGWLAFLKTMIR